MGNVSFLVTIKRIVFLFFHFFSIGDMFLHVLEHFETIKNNHKSWIAMRVAL